MARADGTDPALADTPVPADGDGHELLGRIIDGRYRLDATLGRGGMGLVYRAAHVGLRRQVAVKILHPSLAASPDVRNRFEREALAVGKIDHPNCVSVYDVGRLPDGSRYLAMELLEGRPLSDVLEQEGQIAPGRALHILAGILRGLSHIHGAGLIHRDIKPENIFLIRQGQDEDFAKILDFGIAKPMKASDLDDGVKLTQAGMAFGTPIYMAPEQALGNPMDGRADLYAASVMAYEMLAGQPPFYSDDKLEVMSMHTARPVPPMRTRMIKNGRPVPSSIERLVVRGLTKKPSERWPNADVYLAEVEEALRTPDGGVTDVNFERPSDTGAQPLLDDNGELSLALGDLRDAGSDDASNSIADAISESLAEAAETEASARTAVSKPVAGGPRPPQAPSRPPDALSRSSDAPSRSSGASSRWSDGPSRSLDASSRSPDAPSRGPNPSSRLPDAPSKSLDAPSKLSSAGSRLPDATSVSTPRAPAPPLAASPRSPVPSSLGAASGATSSASSAPRAAAFTSTSASTPASQAASGMSGAPASLKPASAAPGASAAHDASAALKLVSAAAGASKSSRSVSPPLSAPSGASASTAASASSSTSGRALAPTSRALPPSSVASVSSAAATSTSSGSSASFAAASNQHGGTRAPDIAPKSSVGTAQAVGAPAKAVGGVGLGLPYTGPRGEPVFGLTPDERLTSAGTNKTAAEKSAAISTTAATPMSKGASTVGGAARSGAVASPAPGAITRSGAGAPAVSKALDAAGARAAHASTADTFASGGANTRVRKRLGLYVVIAGCAVAIGVVVAFVWPAGTKTGLDPDSPAGAANDAYERGNPARAIQILEANKAAIANDPDAQLVLGHAHAARHESAAALTAYETALKLSPDLERETALRANLRAMAADRDPTVIARAFELWVGATSDPEAKTMVEKAAISDDLARRHTVAAVIEQHELGDHVDWLRAYTFDLAQEPTCPGRKESVAKLRALGDPRAVEPLEIAIQRKGTVGATRGKYINGCLIDDAKAAIGYLRGLPKRPAP